MSRNYPIGTQDFEDIIQSGAIYVDKTHFIVPLIKYSFHKNYFLSRPRRFGKSLFLDAIEQVLSGNQALFKGLYIYDKIDWQKYPVIRLSLDKIGFTEVGLPNALTKAVHKIAAEHQLSLTETTPGLSFAELITQLHAKYQKKVIVLIDEYDKPIIHGIEKDNVTLAETNRDILKAFYGILKGSEKQLRFTFITGVSKISKVSIFSDLNHLDDLTLDADYTTICGFTETEIRHYCATGLQDLAAKEGVTVEQIMDKIRFWYNGFSWNARDFVYNPYSTMVLMQKQVFDFYWFDTGTPTFLVKLIHKNHEYNFKKLKVAKGIYNWHDLKNINYVSVMLQTGYLTFKRHIENNIYEVGYPNNEVENAFSQMLLGDYLGLESSSAENSVHSIQIALQDNNLKMVLDILTKMFKILPYSFFLEDVERRDKKGNITTVQRQVSENFYHAVIYLVFNILAVQMRVEMLSSDGRIDAVVETNTHIYLFEFKKGRKPKDAIQQIWDNQYANLYALSKKQIVCIGVCFTAQKRGISGSVILNLEEVETYLAAL
jgi:hypothetical protein